MATSLLLTILATVDGQKEDFKCPHEYGFYPHNQQCDKYWKCDGQVPELKTCGNGLAFDDTDAKFLKENCDYLHNVDCGSRSQLEPPVGTPHCPRLYGIFPDEQKCDVFWNCWNGEASRYQCSPGLAYDRDARVCMWADQVPECKVEEVANGFNCPAPGDVTNTGSFSRHAHPDDCRKYYICLEGTPREYGCPIGTVFKIGDSDGTGNCEDPEDVPGCEDYYGELDLKGLRKSEFHLGLQKSGNSNKDNTPAPAAKSSSLSSKPRPASSGLSQARAQGPPNALPPPSRNVQKDTIYDEDAA